MAFNAGEDVPTLDWTFRPYADQSGVVPEPSDDDIAAMNKGLRAATAAVLGKDFDPTDKKALAKMSAQVTDEQLAQMKDAQIDALVRVTKDSPSREQLAAIAPRVRLGFLKWLVGELNDPEGERTATTA